MAESTTAASGWILTLFVVALIAWMQVLFWCPSLLQKQDRNPKQDGDTSTTSTTSATTVPPNEPKFRTNANNDIQANGTISSTIISKEEEEQQLDTVAAQRSTDVKSMSSSPAPAVSRKRRTTTISSSTRSSPSTMYKQKTIEQDGDTAVVCPPTDTKNVSGITSSSTNSWRCACEGGFLPPGMLQSFGSAQAVFQLGTGQCYHKQS